LRRDSTLSPASLSGQGRTDSLGGSSVESVEKVPKGTFVRNAEKNNLTECATINDLMLGRGQEIPENHLLIAVRGFFYRLVRLLNTK
jgi:hypothetical protein